MSLKINEIKNVKGLNLYNTNYKDKVGLIYGLNGSGKSTIKYILNTLNNKNAKITKGFGMSEEKTIVDIDLKGNNYQYNDYSWNKSLSNIEIKTFDLEYVHNNIYVDGKLNVSNKENLPIIIFGKENIDKYKKVEKLEKKTKDDRDTLKEYITDALSTKVNKTLDQLLTTFNKIKQILITKYFFKRDVKLEYLLQEHLGHNIVDLEESYVWLKDGLKYKTKRNNCPMCGQFLSEKEKQLFREIENVKLVESNYTEIDNNLRYYINTFKMYLETLPKEVSIGNVIHINNAIDYSYESKRKNWQEEIKIESYKTLKNLEIRLNEYKTKRNIIGKSKNDQEILNSIDYLNDRNIGTFKEIKTLIKSIEKRESIKETTDLEVKNSMRSVLEERVNSINEELSYLSFPYIIDVDQTFDNLKPNATKTKHSSRTGLYLMYKENKESIKETEISSTLSQGEKEVLAWVLFKNDVLHSNKNIHQLIILDDPIASFDEHKRFSVITGIREFTKVNTNTTVLVLTHNKSMVTAFSVTFRNKTYRLKGNELIKVDVGELIKNEYRNNLQNIININDAQINENNITEFLIRSRNLIDMKRKSITDDEDKYIYNNAFDNLSKLMHMTSKTLYAVTLETLSKIIKQHKSDFVLNISSDIYKDNIDLLDIAYKNLDSIYSQRILLENFLRGKVSNHFYTQLARSYNLTVGKLFAEAERRNHLTSEEYKKIKSILPILNIINHSDSIYGQSINDLEDWQLELVKEVTQDLIS